MADKEIWLAKANDDSNNICLGHGTSIKESRDTNTKTTVCFDEVLTNSTSNTSWGVDVGRVSYEGMSTSIEIEDMLEYMLDNDGMITVREVVRPPNEPAYVKVRNYFNARLDGEDYELKPDDYTVSNLKFKTGRRERKPPVLLSSYEE